METISLKLEESLLQDIDNNLRHYQFSTRTEFIRTAIRNQLELLRKEAMIREFMSLRGKGKPKVSEKEYERLREKIVLDEIKRRGLE